MGSLVVPAEDSHSKVFLKDASPRVAGVNGVVIPGPPFCVAHLPAPPGGTADTCPLICRKGALPTVFSLAACHLVTGDAAPCLTSAPAGMSTW